MSSLSSSSSSIYNSCSHHFVQSIVRAHFAYIVYAILYILLYVFVCYTICLYVNVMWFSTGRAAASCITWLNFDYARVYSDPQTAYIFHWCHDINTGWLIWYALLCVCLYVFFLHIPYVHFKTFDLPNNVPGFRLSFSPFYIFFFCYLFYFFVHFAHFTVTDTPSSPSPSPSPLYVVDVYVCPQSPKSHFVVTHISPVYFPLFVVVALPTAIHYFIAFLDVCEYAIDAFYFLFLIESLLSNIVYVGVCVHSDATWNDCFFVCNKTNKKKLNWKETSYIYFFSYVAKKHYTRIDSV